MSQKPGKKMKILGLSPQSRQFRMEAHTQLQYGKMTREIREY